MELIKKKKDDRVKITLRFGNRKPKPFCFALKDIGIAAFFAGLFLSPLGILKGVGAIIYGVGFICALMTKKKK